MDYDKTSYLSLPLLPNKIRYLGYPLIFISLFAAYLYFWGGRPVLFEIPVFAIVTSYAETRWLVLAETNALDEIAIIFALLGLLIIGFSRDKNENKNKNKSRITAIYYAVYITIALWIILYVIIYGWPIIVVSSSIFIVFLTIYILLFRLLVARKGKNESIHLINQ